MRAACFGGMPPSFSAHESYSVEGAVDSPVKRNNTARGLAVGPVAATLSELTERAQRRVQRQQGHAAHRRNRGVVTRPSDKRLVALPWHVILLPRIVGVHAPENRPVTRRLTPMAATTIGQGLKRPSQQVVLPPGTTIQIPPEPSK
jgi:hypothetical protein